MKRKFLSIILFLFILTFTACQNTTTKTNTQNNSSTISNNEETTTISTTKWELVESPDNATYSKNYQALNKLENEEYKQMITVFSIPMTEDRKKGEQITNNEYVEAFPGIGPNTIIVRIRINKNSYWVMSRQSFTSKNDYTGQYDVPYDTLIYTENLQNKIDNTRYILNNEF